MTEKEEVPDARNQAALNDLLQSQASELIGLLSSGRMQQGDAMLAPLLQKYPHWGFGWKLRAGILVSLGQYDRALPAVQEAARWLSDDAELLNIAAILLREAGQIDRSIHCFLKSIEMDPLRSEVHNNLGGAFMLKGDADRAFIAFSRAIQLSPDYPEAHQNLGNALIVRKQPEKSIAMFLRAAELNPSMQGALSMACMAMLQSADWGALEQVTHRLQENLGRPGFQAPTPFLFCGLPGTTRQQHLQCARHYVDENIAGFLSRPPLCNRKISIGTRLRIGYLSADFHEHATAYLLAGVLENHDHARFEIFAYSYGPRTGDAMRQRIERACDAFRNIDDCSHEEAAQRILEDRIDILVDLKGYTEHARPQIVALRPAPVVVNWLGYPSTMGHRRIADYIVGDPVVTPLAHQPDYSETLALMPDCYQPTDDRRVSDTRPTRRDAGLPDDGFVFCSFNQIYKITPVAFDAWCRIAAGTPGSVLWLLEGTQAAMDRLRSEADRRGLSPGRLVFARKLPQAGHLARLPLADLALDTFPYTSHTTANDALWMGVPLLTRLGDTFGSRVAASVLSAAGLEALIVDDWNRYVEVAINLAQAPEQLARMREGLARLRRDGSGLFDTARFTRNMENLLITIRDQQIEGRPQAFVQSRSV